MTTESSAEYGMVSATIKVLVPPGASHGELATDLLRHLGAFQLDNGEIPLSVSFEYEHDSSDDYDELFAEFDDSLDNLIEDQFRDSSSNEEEDYDE